MEEGGELSSGATPQAEREQERRPSDAGWAAAPAGGAHGSHRWLLPLVLLAALGAGGWWGSGALLADRARQQVADRWDALRICLLGEGLEPGLKPSERFRYIWLAVGDSAATDDWPARCEPLAEALDAALTTRSAHGQLGPLPSALEIVRSSQPEEHADQLDLLHSELELADLPLPKRSGAIPPAPAPARPLLRAADLAALGRAPALSDVHASLDLQRGQVLRLSLHEPEPLVCRLNDGPRDQRWQSVACHAVPLSLTGAEKVRLAQSEVGAADLVQLYDSGDADGFYDSTTGQRLWRPRYFDTQAVVRKSGVTSILHGETREGSELERVQHFRLLTLQPGKRPRDRRLSVPSTSRVLLLADSLLWWGPGAEASPRDEVFVQELGDGLQKPGAARPIGQIPTGSRQVASCAAGDALVVLLATGIQQRRYTLLFRKAGGYAPPLDVGVISGRLELSCHAGRAVLSRTGARAITLWRCDERRCQRSSSEQLPMLEDGSAALAPLGDRVALVWTRPGEPLRLRSGAAERLHELPDTLLLDAFERGDLEVEALRLITSDGLGLLLVQDIAGRVFPIRLGAAGTPSTVRVVR